MGQTLSHGVYLPAEGERNCYSGLASNWNLLDTAIGDTAGKASATHTHGNITNDGKLATASKALVTDSNKNITTSSVSDTELSYLSGVTSAIQTQLNAKANDSGVVHKTENETIDGIKTFLQPMYNRGSIRFSSDSFVTGTPSNNLFYAPIAIGGLVNSIWNAPFMHNAAIRTTGINDYSIRVYSQTSNTLTGVVAETNADASDISFRPIVNANHNLGTSSYQWKSVYAQSYYYNGTAWGLDKANTWSNINIYQREICISGDRTAYISPMWEGAASGIAFLNSDATKTFTFGQYTTDANNRRIADNTKGRLLIRTGERNNETVVELEPRATNATLGTSTNKWKSFNGINPGALSLPNLDSAVSLTTILQAAIDKTQTTNNWTANFTGILCINWITKNLTGPFRCSVYNASDIKNATWGQTFWADNVWYFIVSFPVQNGKTYYFDNTFTRTSEDSAHIVHSANAIYTLGNV